MKRLAIDPGDVHVGWAYDMTDGRDLPTTGEWRPTEAVDRVVDMMTKNLVDELVIEEFVLYPEQALNQVWSPMLTPQLIGGLKVVAYFFHIPVVEQGANIKKPTERQLSARKIKRVGKGSHARDAELHLHYRRLRS